MRVPQLVLAGACVVIGLCPADAYQALTAATLVLGATAASAPGPELAVLGRIHLGLFVVLVLIYFWAARRRVPLPQRPTWDCGYVAPTARMQYTASSIAADLVGYFAPFLRPRTKPANVEGPWPASSQFASHVPEVVLELFILPLLRTVGRAIVWLRHLQRGTAHAYVLYVLLTLLVMLSVWR
jgi:hydrogenase-4 component B